MRVRDVMTRGPIHVRPETSVRNARWLMRLYSTEHLPVVAGDHPVAMLSYHEIEVTTGRAPRVQGLVPPSAHTIGPEETLEAAQRLLQACHAEALVVIEEDRLVGVLSRAQVQRAGR